MLEHYKKKTVKIFKELSTFFNKYLAKIVFLVFLLQLLLAIGNLPRFNVIDKYYVYVIGIVWIVANILFKIHITNNRILILGLIMFLLAIPPTVLQFGVISDWLGFGAFLLLCTYIIRQIVIERKKII